MAGRNGWLFVFAQFFRRTTKKKTHMRTKDTLNQDTTTLTFTKMDTFDTLMKRNKDFAVEQSASGLLMPALPRALPNLKALIIGCADMRVDPVHVLVSGLEKLS
jgi:hypothetical protein